MASIASESEKRIDSTIVVPNRVRDGALHDGGAPRARSTLRRISGDFYILASAMASRRSTRVLAHGESFAVFETTGDILESPLEALGFFYRDTRHLSCFEIGIAGEVPHFLNSYVSDDNTEVRANLTNPDLRGADNSKLLERDLIQIQRSWVLNSPRLYQRIAIQNFAPSTVKIELNFSLGADFRDMFEVRGLARKKRGEMHPAKVGRNSVEFRYDGLDHIRRATVIGFSRKPTELAEANASFAMSLKHREAVEIEVCVEACQEQPRANGKIAVPRAFGDALERRRAEVGAVASGFTHLSTSNQVANSLINRSLGDLAALTTMSERGHSIMAGIPWFATLFGRTASLPRSPCCRFFPISRREFCAPSHRCRAPKTTSRGITAGRDHPRDARLRDGEHRRDSVRRYYGSVDSTPLFLWLMGRYVGTTGDLKLAGELWPNVERGLDWIGNHGDRDGDGYIEYQRETPRGLANQGWKDSLDSISHADGSSPRRPSRSPRCRVTHTPRIVRWLMSRAGSTSMICGSICARKPARSN